jgi:hypothetical protein
VPLIESTYASRFAPLGMIALAVCLVCLAQSELTNQLTRAE